MKKQFLVYLIFQLVVISSYGQNTPSPQVLLEGSFEENTPAGGKFYLYKGDQIKLQAKSLNGKKFNAYIFKEQKPKAALELLSLKKVSEVDQTITIPENGLYGIGASNSPTALSMAKGSATIIRIPTKETENAFINWEEKQTEYRDARGNYDYFKSKFDYIPKPGKPLTSSASGVNRTITLVGDSVLVDGKPLFVVKKTKKGDLVNPLAEFTIYDLKGKAHIKFENGNGNFLFLSDSKSFIPRKVDPYAKQIAEFFGKDSLFTKNGYNRAYEEAFIKRHGGFVAPKNTVKDKDGLVVRNKKAPWKIVEKQIIQDDQIIGRVNYQEVKGQKVLVINNRDGKFSAAATYTCPNMCEVKITRSNTLDSNYIKTFPSVYPQDIEKQVVNWLIENNYL